MVLARKLPSSTLYDTARKRKAQTHTRNFSRRKWDKEALQHNFLDTKSPIPYSDRNTIVNAPSADRDNPVFGVKMLAHLQRIANEIVNNLFEFNFADLQSSGSSKKSSAISKPPVRTELQRG